MHLEISSAKLRPFRPRGDELNHSLWKTRICFVRCQTIPMVAKAMQRAKSPATMALPCNSKWWSVENVKIFKSVFVSHIRYFHQHQFNGTSFFVGSVHPSHFYFLKIHHSRIEIPIKIIRLCHLPLPMITGSNDKHVLYNNNNQVYCATPGQYHDWWYW